MTDNEQVEAGAAMRGSVVEEEDTPPPPSGAGLLPELRTAALPPLVNLVAALLATLNDFIIVTDELLLPSSSSFFVLVVVLSGETFLVPTGVDGHDEERKKLQRTIERVSLTGLVWFPLVDVRLPLTIDVEEESEESPRASLLSFFDSSSHVNIENDDARSAPLSSSLLH